MARALVSDARVIVFDEPTSSLTERDAARLFAVIERLRAKGLAIVYISHFLEEVRRVARPVHGAPRRPDGRGGPDGGHELDGDHRGDGRPGADELFPQVPHAPGDPCWT